MKKLKFAIVALGLSGCSSFQTTAVDRVDNDMLVVNPHRPMKGVPVSLRVPSHLELSVVETTYWEKRDIPGKTPTLEPLSTCRPTRSVSHNVCYTEKVFLVDPVRPCSGTENYGFGFQGKGEGENAENQGKGYLRNVSYKVDDTTIKESANLVANSISLINALQTSAAPAIPNSSDLVATDRAVAYGRFDINSPSYEADVAAFLDCHVNCSDGTGVVPTICGATACQ